MNDLFYLIKYIIINNNYYNKYYKYINKEYISINYKELLRLYNTIKYWYENNNTGTSIQNFSVFFFSAYPALKRDEIEYYSALFEKLDALELDDVVVEQALEGYRKRSVASHIASLARDIASGQRPFEELSGALEDATKDLAVEEEESPFLNTNLSDILSEVYRAPGLKWRILTLRRMLGSLRKGDFGFIFARPEAGKTTFIADMCSYFASQVDGPIIHFNNEELGKKIYLRYIQAYFGVTIDELTKNEKEFSQRFEEEMGKKILLVDRKTITRWDVEDICAKHQPSLIVMDSIDKIQGFKEDRDDLMYKQIYQWARELAKQHCPVIGVCHAHGMAEGKRWLEMDDVAYAKTAKQAEGDWILGIGHSHDQREENIRFLHACKNKQIGDPDFREEYRHGRLPVMFFPDIARFDDMAEVVK